MTPSAALFTQASTQVEKDALLATLALLLGRTRRIHRGRGLSPICHGPARQAAGSSIRAQTAFPGVSGVMV